MNILDVLRKLGYDVCAFTEDGVYTVMLSSEHIARIVKRREEMDIEYYGSLYDTYKIRVSEVYFNKFGDLVVAFKEVDNEEDGDFDVYEYRNMRKEDLFD